MQWWYQPAAWSAKEARLWLPRLGSPHAVLSPSVALEITSGVIPVFRDDVWYPRP